MLNLSWLNDELKSLVYYYLQKDKEIPDYIGYYSPLIVEGLSTIIQSKLLPYKQNNLLYLDKIILYEESKNIAQRVSHIDYIHVVGVSGVTIESCASLLGELAIQKNLYCYTSVTPKAELNQLNIDQTKDYLQEIKDTNLKTHQIQIEPELHSFGNLLDEPEEGKKTHRMFLLLDSRLGNSPDPKFLLKNIAASMRKQDYLILVQELYNPGCEPLLIADYNEALLDKVYAKNDIEIANSITPNHRFLVSWFNNYHGQYQGVTLDILLKEKVQINNLIFEEGQTISLFKAITFTKSQMREIFDFASLVTVHISYDREQNLGLYILQKK